MSSPWHRSSAEWAKRMTPNQAALLRAIGRGQVMRLYPLGIDPSYVRWAGKKTVTAQVEKWVKAGLVETGERTHAAYRAPRLIQLTQLGMDTVLRLNPEPEEQP